MIVYLFWIFVSTGEYLSPDYSMMYSNSSLSIVSLGTYNNNIVVLSKSPGLCLTILDLEFNFMFSYALEGNNTYEPVRVIAKDIIYVLANAIYNGGPVPNLLGNYIPRYGNSHGLLLVFNYQAQVVRSQWVGDCMNLNSRAYDMYVNDRVYIATSSQCQDGVVSIQGLRGESVIRLNSNGNKFMLKGFNAQVFLGISDNNSTNIVNLKPRTIIYTLNEAFIDFTVSDSIFILLSSTIVSLNYSGELIGSVHIPLVSLKSLDYSDSILITGNIYRNILDYKLNASEGVIILKYSPSLQLLSYRPISINSEVSTGIDTGSGIILSFLDYITFTEDAFSLYKCNNCYDPVYNFLGQCVCNQCYQGYSLFGFSCLIQLDCRLGTVQDYYSMSCVGCSPGCLNCTGPGHDQCEACFQGYSWFDNQCLINCPVGMYSYNQVCLKCPANCSSCISSYCLSCETGYLLNGTCTNSCGLGHYEVGNVCNTCEYPCLACNVSQCYNCSSGYFLDSYQCTACADNCLDCDGNDCAVCRAGFILDDGICRSCQFCEDCDKGVCSSCTPGNFLSNNSCAPCSHGCKVCNATACAECNSGWHLNETCIKCNSSCDLCDQNGCTKCKRGWYLDKSGCASCGPGCANCSESTCFECSSGVLVGGVCSNNCSHGYEMLNNTCTECPNGCSECALGICTRCFNATDQHFISVLRNGTCDTKNCVFGYIESNRTCIFQQSYYYSYFQAILAIVYELNI